MKAKQVLSMLLAVVMAGSLAACGNTSGNEQVQEKAGQSEQTEQERQEYQNNPERRRRIIMDSVSRYPLRWG